MFRFRDYFENYDGKIQGSFVVLENCTLKKPIGDYKIGHTFPFVEFNFLEMELCFYDENEHLVMTRSFLLNDTSVDN